MTKIEQTIAVKNERTIPSLYRKLSSPLGLAVLDLVPYRKGYMVTRVNVPAPHRRKGIGTALLTECITQADLERVPLYLEINPYGEMSYKELAAWYRKFGFRKRGQIFRRKPR